MKSICVITGTRAEYGLLKPVIQRIKISSVLKLQLIVTGMHLSPEFGHTIQEIESDLFFIDRKIELLLSSDSPVGISKSVGLGMIGFADALSQLNPDLILILGDRFEILSAAICALIARIPVAHISGGETTEGVIDESIRHSITKMSHLHFVGAEEYRNRVIQLGEAPNTVYNVGGLGIDTILDSQLLSLSELEDSLGFTFQPQNLLCTFHPVTLEQNTSLVHINELLAALDSYPSMGIIFTMPNADTDGRIVMNRINEFCATRSNSIAFLSLGHIRYLSCLQFVDGVIGNSSSGLAEVPSFKIGTINIGDRQRGRLKASSVIDCNPDRKSISRAIAHLYSESFQKDLPTTINPYGSGGASESITKILENVDLQEILKKSFYNISVS